ncbi:MAG: galactokinase [Anaerolineales bacterium]
MEINARRSMISAEFHQHFGRLPEIWARAPGRVDLMGSHTDYNQGFVLTMTIDRDTWIAAAPRSDRTIEVYSLNLEGGGPFDLEQIRHDQQWPWTDYVRGVAKMYQQAGYGLAGFDAVIHSNIPFGSGLSSSAAIEMATAEVIQMVGGFQVNPVEKALLGQMAENQFVGVNTGILDQYSSALGREGSAILLDCRDLSNRVMTISEDLNVMVCDTRTERKLKGTEYDDRRAQCEEGVRLLQDWYPQIQALRDVSMEQFEPYETELPPAVAKRCRFIIEENQRVLNLADTLPTGDRKMLQKLLSDSFAGARDLYEISTPAMEAMMVAMMDSDGVIGARQAGAGFGGSMVSLVENSHVLPFAEGVRRKYQERTGIDPYVYNVEPAPGSGPLVMVE